MTSCSQKKGFKGPITLISCSIFNSCICRSKFHTFRCCKVPGLGKLCPRLLQTSALALICKCVEFFSKFWMPECTQERI